MSVDLNTSLPIAKLMENYRFCPDLNFTERLLEGGEASGALSIKIYHKDQKIYASAAAEKADQLASVVWSINKNNKCVKELFAQTMEDQREGVASEEKTKQAKEVEKIMEYVSSVFKNHLTVQAVSDTLKPYFGTISS